MTEDPARRSRIMRRVKSTNTQPEMRVRRLVHGMGFRYRLHVKDLPGKPDLVFRRRRAVIFVHGCFWHGHHCPRGARIPKNNREYWQAKIACNIDRDARNQAKLAAEDWRVLVLWECQLKDEAALKSRLQAFLSD